MIQKYECNTIISYNLANYTDMLRETSVKSVYNMKIKLANANHIVCCVAPIKVDKETLTILHRCIYLHAYSYRANTLLHMNY